MTHLEKQAVISKCAFKVPWQEGLQASKRMLATNTLYGAGAGSIGNYLLGDEKQSAAERIIKGLLFGSLSGAASAVPIGVASTTLAHLLVRAQRGNKLPI